MALYLFLTTLILRPILSFVFIIFNFVPFVKARLSFERKNYLDECSDLDNHLLEKMHSDGVCFLVSSEGEFEQVLPLIEANLEKNAWTEIIYTSPSVEKKITNFVERERKHRKKIFALRLPLISYFPVNFFIFQSPLSWSKSKTIVFCRYDFFPELLFFKYLNRNLILVSATLKNKNISGVRQFYLKSFFNHFDHIIPASMQDHEKICAFTLGSPSRCQAPFDFRVSRILRRIEDSEQSFKTQFGLEHFYKLMTDWKNKHSDSSLIVGSLWPSDLPVIFSKNSLNYISENQFTIFIYPHKLKDQNLISLVRNNLHEKAKNIEFVLVSNFDELNALKELKKSCVYYIDVGGILVESYQFFKLAYVGGGFERSIHSVLEPYMAESFVLTGIKTHRSTEWDLINQDPHVSGGISVGNDVEFLASLKLIIQSKVSIRGSKNYQSLLQWNRDRIRALVNEIFNR